jgi:hypothetical protein
MAEYGQELVETLLRNGSDLPPYIAEVARLDWALGILSVATDHKAIGIDALAAVPADELEQATLTLQPGLAHMATAWPVDALVQLRLAASAPEQLAFLPEETWRELRGARGRFTMHRLDPGAFTFRARLGAGDSLGIAAEEALANEPSFDVALALAALFAEGLVITHSGENRHA